MKSASLYECEIYHRRLSPVSKAFSYHVFMLNVDLDELSETVEKTHWLAHNRWHLFSINDHDHIDVGEKGGIKKNLLAWLAEQKMAVPDDTRVHMVTFPRVLGYGFNPVTFYYLRSAADEPLFAVAEVTNTFREMKIYPVCGAKGDGWECRVAKDFYVSPFSDPGDDFDFKIGPLRDKWLVKINNINENKPVLVSNVRGNERELTSTRLFWYAIKFPLLSLKIIGMIYWQAFKLWFAKVPYFKKSEHRESQRDLMRPHESPNNKKS